MSLSPPSWLSGKIWMSIRPPVSCRILSTASCPRLVSEWVAGIEWPQRSLKSALRAVLMEKIPALAAIVVPSRARLVRALGFSHIGVNDHIIVPSDINSRYPYTDHGQWPGKVFGECLDVLATLAFLA